MGVTINALVVSDDEGDLASYYTKNVILGANAFVMDIRQHADYSTAIKTKLIRELSSRAVATPSATLGRRKKSTLYSSHPEHAGLYGRF
ncbi:uncharacterized protein DUF1194 [Phyllobacterium brassicacearum]|nr:uncharacterized protein DUF1194 [Phyllobacterium brassicacearum]